jgi:hypothetical protein
VASLVAVLEVPAELQAAQEELAVLLIFSVDLEVPEALLAVKPAALVASLASLEDLEAAMRPRALELPALPRRQLL